LSCSTPAVTTINSIIYVHSEASYFMDLSAPEGNASWFDAGLYTLKIELNASDRYIPLSTTVSTLTTTYPIDVTVDGGTAIDIGTSAIGVNFTGTYTTGIDLDGAATGIDISAAGTANIAISGANATGINMTGTYSTAGISIVTDMAAYNDYCIYIAADCDDTSGTVVPLYVITDLDVANCNGRAAEFVLAPTAKMGGWGNAIKGYLNLSGALGSAGTLAGICAEVLLPSGAMDGTVGVLELEMTAPGTLYTYGLGDVRNLAFILMNATGSTINEYEGTGALININGLSDSDGYVWFDNTLRIGINGAAWYIPLSTTQASYTTEYPIVSTYSGGDSITATITNPTSEMHAFKSTIDCGGATGWTSGGVFAYRGQVNLAVTAGDITNAFAGWFGLEFSAALAATGGGLTSGVYIETRNIISGAHPNAALYIQEITETPGDSSGM
ncbi:unnamed protein product, partial [marine sediment metagenome]